jgi:hypothetical protein
MNPCAFESTIYSGLPKPLPSSATKAVASESDGKPHGTQLKLFWQAGFDCELYWRALSRIFGFMWNNSKN